MLFADVNQYNATINESQDRELTELSKLLKTLNANVNLRLDKLQGEFTEHLERSKNYVKVYDFKREKLPNETFDCVPMARIVVQPSICIHDISRDMFVSKSIKNTGVWERLLVRLFMTILDLNPDLQVFDIGAQLGQFTLYAAKLGRTSVAVEPFYDNYVRLHASALRENLTERIILVNNGITDHRGDVAQLKMNPKNIGGQRILDNEEASGDEKNVKDKYSLVTIVLDDLISVLPGDFRQAIMKIDIEGYELKAFRHSANLLKRVEIPVILMEWLGKADKSKFPREEIDDFLNFMQSKGYTCRSVFSLNELNRKSYRSWPNDVIFVLNSYFPTLRQSLNSSGRNIYF
jgi:FkbM family methyltransferase